MTRAADLPRSTPEAQGIPSSAIGAFIDAAERDLDAIHSFMLLRHGRVVAEGWWDPYRPQDRHVLFSLSKRLHLNRYRPPRGRGAAIDRRSGAGLLPRRCPVRAERQPAGDACAPPPDDDHRPRPRHDEPD